MTIPPWVARTGSPITGKLHSKFKLSGTHFSDPLFLSGFQMEPTQDISISNYRCEIIPIPLAPKLLTLSAPCRPIPPCLKQVPHCKSEVNLPHLWNLAASSSHVLVVEVFAMCHDEKSHAPLVLRKCVKDPGHLLCDDTAEQIGRTGEYPDTFHIYHQNEQWLDMSRPFCWLGKREQVEASSKTVRPNF